MSVIDKVLTARKEHHCGWDCGTPIKPGDRYTRSSATPNDNDLGNTRWWHMTLHGTSRYDCPDYTTPVTCRCGQLIIRCVTQPSHIGCSSGYGWIHLDPWGHSCQPRSGAPYAPQADPQPASAAGGTVTAR